MAGGGRDYRYQAQPVQAGDPLPTAETIALAKGFAARACAERAADSVWSSHASAHTWIERTPMLALAALIVVCPECSPERLARCLGLDPLGIHERLRNVTDRATWPEGMVAVVAQQIAGGV